MRTAVVGAAFALAIAAFVLALWPAVADAPWEELVVEAPAQADASAPQPESAQEDRSETCADLINLGVRAKGGPCECVGFVGMSKRKPVKSTTVVVISVKIVTRFSSHDNASWRPRSVLE